jgi:ABC-type bacteriocin/lantibiotic exporter with double-glycine peptidase domain
VTPRTWRAFAGFFTDSRRLLALSLLVSVLQSVLLLPVALLVKKVFDTQVPDGDEGGLVVSGALILALYLGSASLGLWTRHTALRAIKAAITRLRGDLMERLYAFPRAYFDRRSLGQLHSTIVEDSERVDVMSNALVAQLLPAVVVSLGLAAILAVLNGLLFLVLLCVVPLLLGLGRWLGRHVRGRTRRWQQAFDVFSAHTQLALRAMTLTKVRGAERHELERQRRQFEELGDAGREMAFAQSAYAIVQGAVAASAGVVVLVVGGRSVARGSMSIGELLSFYAVLALLLRQVTTIVSTAPLALAGYESFMRLQAVLENDEPEPYRGSRQIDFRGSLEVTDASFSYGREPLLRDVSLRIEPGELIALVGPNGAGKTTLLSLVLGLYRPHRGRLAADGIPYEEIDFPYLRRQIGVVLQDPIIFPATIGENIAYGHPEATGAEVEQAAAGATAHDFIGSFPDGYNTWAGDEGSLLSGGQRQRIAIARALLAHPSLLILDEPTTHLDDDGIRRLMENLRALPGSPSLLMVSHDVEVARAADRIYHLRDGAVVGEEAGVVL